MELSWIQKHALLVLIRHKTARVKDLMPLDVAANLFAYHLDGLATAKLIEKSARGVYRLTATGEKFVGTFSTALDCQVENIKTVVMLYGRRGHEYLLFRWSRQPYLGYVTPLYDRVPLGKSLEAGIASALGDKLGVVQPATFKTSALIKITHGGKTISHMNALVYEVDLGDNVELPFVSRNGEAFVGEVSELNDIMGGVADFLSRVQSSTQPFDAVWRY